MLHLPNAIVRNKILASQNSKCEWSLELEHIRRIFVNYYKELFKTSPSPNIRGVSNSGPGSGLVKWWVYVAFLHAVR